MEPTSLKSRKYSFDAVLGEGSSGVVLKGHRLSNGEPVVAKIVKKSTIPPERLAIDKTQNGADVMVPMEAYILRRLKHPHIVGFLDFFQDRRCYYLVLEQCQKGTTRDLFEYIETHGRFSVDQAAYILVQLVETLIYLQSMHVYHMDLKDENISIDDQLNIKLIDFGSAHVVPSPQQTLFDMFYGTVTYAAPEILSGKVYRVDLAEIWSLGVLFYLLLAGYMPFDTGMQAVKHPPKPMPHVTRECADLLNWMLTKDPNGRPTLHQILEHPFLNRYR